MQQTLEEKAVIVAKAIASRQLIYIDGEEFSPYTMGLFTDGTMHVSQWYPCKHIELSKYGVTVSLTPPPPALLPCPFCHSVSIIESNLETKPRYLATCTVCGVTTHWHQTQEQAISAWNRRAG